MHPSTIARGMIARLGIRPYPLSLSYEVTWRCNLACAYCDRHTPMPRELARDEILTALGEFYALGMRDVHLDGGDPLMHRHVGEIVDWLVERRIPVSMNTNGILVSRKIDTVRKLSGVTVSLDGPRANHDGMRGAGSFDRAIAGAKAAQAAGVSVEFTCTVGSHNADAIEDVVALADALQIPVVFQPALNSLFLDTERDGSGWQLDPGLMRATFARIEQIKRRSRAVGNAWSSLRHFRQFPEDTAPPCAAGWVTATMDPEGVLFPCGQLSRRDRSNSVVRLGAARAFANLPRNGCAQCWCARLVQENYTWGMRLDRMLPPFRTQPVSPTASPR
jgi:MoaA/NifB/PqqE/SkfB family radical SAM enzyme